MPSNGININKDLGINPNSNVSTNTDVSIPTTPTQPMNEPAAPAAVQPHVEEVVKAEAVQPQEHHDNQITMPSSDNSKIKTPFVRIIKGSEIDGYLLGMMVDDATDIYITVGLPICYRIENDIYRIGDENLTEEQIQAILAHITTEKQRDEFVKNNELNFGVDRGEVGRFRINVMRQRGKTAIVIRKITSKIPTFEDLQLPKIMEDLSREQRGLVLIVGVTSSGKSTSLAAMMDYRNTHIGGHIITIENPVEYYHDHKMGIVNQREVGSDTDSFHIALKNALRQKPDVILVGEIRDVEVMEQAIVAAETGHLCYATLHTANAAQAVDRIVNFFPEERQDQIRIALSLNLRAIVAQRLVKKKGGGMIVVPEVMLNEALIKDLILKGDTKKVREVMANNVSMGMSTFDISLFRLFKEDKITEETLIREAELAADMRIKLQEYKTTPEYRERFASEGEKDGKGSQGKGEYSSLDIDTSGLSL